MSPLVSSVHVRGILDSRAEPTVEAEVTLASGAWGRGSSPRAIAPGGRERRGREERLLGPGAGLAPLPELEAEFRTQAAFDAAVAGLAKDVALALSLAFCRASCAELGRPLHEHLAELAGSRPALPHPLVNFFSGGIHTAGEARSLQQIMVAPDGASLAEDLDVALRAYAAVERKLRERGVPISLSASSGFVVEGVSDERLLEELRETLDEEGLGELGLGVDVAAEHLTAGGGAYRLDGRRVRGEELVERLERLASEHGLVYVEDPFAPEDGDLWRELTSRLGDRALVVGDDLFVTSAAYVEPGLANAILLKPSQAGTVTATLEGARAARNAGLELCVSHRSGETEDVAICDLAVALGARYVKVGGPRRGDRIAKLNQLVRLAETVEPGGPIAAPTAWRVDRSFQTDARAKPARPDGGTASGALGRSVGPYPYDSET
jgi:enolase